MRFTSPLSLHRTVFRPGRWLATGLLFAGLAVAQVSAQVDSGSTGSIGESGSTGDTGSGTPAPGSIGYSPLSNTIAPTIATFFSFVSGSTTGTAFVVPFQINGLGTHYSLASVKLLISGTGSVNHLAVSVSSTLPTSFTAPTSLVTFSNGLTGSPGLDAVSFSFAADSSPTLISGTTYYLRVGYTGDGTLNWVQTSDGGFGSGDIPALTFVDTAFAAGTFITYRRTDAGGFTDLYDNIGGFSITANAVSAVPEPAALAGLAGAAALVAGLFVRWRRRRTETPPAPETPVNG